VEKKLTNDELAKYLGPQSPISKLLNTSLLSKIHPQTPGHFEVWVDDNIIRGSKLSIGDEIRFKTLGDFLILTSAQLTSVTNFDKMEGGKVMNQVSKISDQYTATTLPQDQMEGVDESEWD